jgi:hypothetical protein
MKRALVLAGVLMLGACATSQAPPAMLADQARVTAAIAPGATRASVQAALGPATAITFDSGYEVWLYQVARPGGQHAEQVLLFNRAGLLSRSRLREPTAASAN